MKLQLLVTLSLALVVLAACNVSATDNDKDCEKKKQFASDQAPPPPSPQQPSPPIHHHHKHHHRKHRHHRHHHKNNSWVSNGGNTGASTPANPPPQSNNKNNGNNGNKNHQLSPQGLKAGISGQEAAGLLSSSISWINNWGAKPYEAVPHGVEFVTQCYGFGMSGHDDDWKRFEDFKKIKPGHVSAAEYCDAVCFQCLIFSLTRPLGSLDRMRLISRERQVLVTSSLSKRHKCGINTLAHGRMQGPSSCELKGMIVVKTWQHADHRSLHSSPSCAKQRDEDYLPQFLDAVTVKPGESPQSREGSLRRL